MSATFDPALENGDERRGDKTCGGGLLEGGLWSRGHGEYLPYARLETVAQDPRRGSAVWTHERAEEVLSGSNVREQVSCVDKLRVVWRRTNDGADDALELRAQEVVLGGVMSVEGGAADASFLHDVADTNIAVGAAMEEIDKSGIDAGASAPDTLIFAVGAMALRDICRFLFRIRHGNTCFCCVG